MSTGSIIQLVATAAGAFFGGPWGAIAGSLIGGYAGRSVDGGKDIQINQQGPRLSDNKVQISTYGAAIPRAYGRVQIAGNVIWSSDLIEHVTTTSSTQDSGKGGGGDSQTVNQTTYSYSVHAAIGLCAGPIIGIGKIWANGKLIYNGKAGTDPNTVLASQTLADGIRVYVGSETQTADALIESYEGVGNVPGYRGLAYVLFEDFQLAEFGNRIPQFEFEIISSATTQMPGIMGTIPTTANADSISYDNGVYAVGTITIGGATSSLRKKTYDFSGTLLSDQTTSRTRSLGAGYHVQGNWDGLLLRGDGATVNQFWNLETDQVVEADWMGGDLRGFPVIQKGSNYAWFIYKRNSDNMVRLAKLPIDTGFTELSPGDNRAVGVPGNYPEKILDLWTSADDHPALFFDGTWVWVTNSVTGILYRYTQDLVLSKQWTYASPAGTHGFIYTFDNRFAIGPSYFGADSRIFQLNDDGTTTALVTAAWNDGFGAAPYPATPGVLIGLTKLVTVYPLITATVATLSDIVQAECLLSGLVAGDLDVTALTDNVTGFTVQRAALNACIQPLAQAFFFDAVESDGKLKFVKRNGASVVTFAASDLAAHSPGESVPETIHHEHGMDLDLPNEVTVSFFDDDNAYQQGEQYGRRLATNAKGQNTVSLPIVLTNTQALAIAEALLFEAWAARESFSIQTSRKFAKYEPGDVVTLPFPINDTTAVRILKRDEGANGVIRFDCVFCESTVYTQTGTAQATDTPAETTSVPGPTLAYLLDIPLLRDVDDSYGFYAAALGYLDAWRGAQLYASHDGGATYDDMEGGLLLNSASMGYAETVLGTPIFLEQFDEKCTVDVKLINGTLASVTRDQVLNFSNIALLGDEIIQFRDVTQLASGEYRLAGLLRGRFGTDWAVGTHAINERFVLLDSSTIRFERSGSGDVGVESMVKAVSIGNRLAGTPEQLFTYEGVNLTPLAPVHFVGGRDPTGNLNMGWRRRTRLNATWRDYVDAPLGEESESYSIDVLNGSTVVRTIAATTNNAQYTAAQQTTDFGSPQASVVVNLYQVSTRIGRGYAAAATL